MEHDLSPEANELRDMVRTFFERKAPESAVREAWDLPGARDLALWDQMAGQLGLMGLLVPDEYGGQGTTLVEAEVVLEEFGRAAVPGPFLSSAVLTPVALLAAADPAAEKEFLPGIADGSTTATVALSRGVLTRADESTVTATEAGGVWSLTGTVAAVLDGADADLLFVVAATPDGSGLFQVDTASVTRTPLAVLDLGRPVARIELAGATARRIGADFTAGEEKVLAVAAVALAAESAGATQRLLEMSVDYAKLREQFGVPIGSFQAVKHLCAEIFVVAESATSIARYAARVGSEDESELASVASVAKAYVSEEAPGVGEKTIQIHGGIGYTWEHPAHIYLRRLKANEALFGSAAYHRSLLAAETGLVTA